MFPDVQLQKHLAGSEQPDPCAEGRGAWGAPRVPPGASHRLAVVVGRAEGGGGGGGGGGWRWPHPWAGGRCGGDRRPRAPLGLRWPRALRWPPSGEDGGVAVGGRRDPSVPVPRPNPASSGQDRRVRGRLRGNSTARRASGARGLLGGGRGGWRGRWVLSHVATERCRRGWASLCPPALPQAVLGGMQAPGQGDLRHQDVGKSIPWDHSIWRTFLPPPGPPAQPWPGQDPAAFPNQQPLTLDKAPQSSAERPPSPEPPVDLAHPSAILFIPGHVQPWLNPGLGLPLPWEADET